MECLCLPTGYVIDNDKKNMFKLVYMFTGQTDHFPFLSSAIWALRGLKYMCPVQNHIIAFIRATAVCYEKNANLFQNEDLSSLF